MKSRDRLRIGAGAGTSDDRMVPALELAEHGELDTWCSNAWQSVPSRGRTDA